MKTPTLSEFQAWARENHRLAHSVCLAQAFAECERKRVDAYVLPIFNSYTWTVRPEFQERRNGGVNTIDKPGDLYLSDQEEQLAEYYAACKAAHIAHGWRGDPDHCPALSADSLLMEAQQALLESGSELLGVNLRDVYGDLRKRALDLLLGACLAPQPGQKRAA